MIVVYLLLLLFYLILYLISLQERHCHKIRSPLKRIAGMFYHRKGGRNILNYQVEKDIQMLYPGKREHSELEDYYIQKISRTLLVFLIGDLLAILLFAGSRMDGSLKEGQYILRKSYGEGATAAELQVRDIEGEAISGDIMLEVGELKYQENELRIMAEALAKQLPDEILGGNSSPDEVRQNMNLVRAVEGYPFSIGWESDDYGVIDMNGTVKNEELVGEGIAVTLTAVIRYEEFEQYVTLPVRVCPKVYSPEEAWDREIKAAVGEQEEAQAYTDRLILPDSVNGYEVKWQEIKEDNSGLIFLLLAVAAAAMFILEDRKLHERAEERNRQLLMDYPMLVQKLTLYMGAGMTIRNAFRKICSEYQNGDVRRKKRFLYEEMLLACHEMDSGIPETSAYELFGKRCRLPQYTKLVSLLSQNLKRGSNSLQVSLREEAKNAFEDRKNAARKLGEEAGTKLLFPMMLMLMVVMVLIIIPAYFTFSM